MKPMIRINRTNVPFILKTLQLPPDLRPVLQATSEGGNLSDDHADALPDCCTARLDEVGFDTQYEVTAEGKKREQLVNKLFVG